MKFLSSKIVIAFALILCSLLPVCRYENQTTESWGEKIDYATDKLKNDKTGLLSDAWEGIKGQLFETNEVKSLSTSEKVTQVIYTGFNFGLSSIGCLKGAISNVKFKLYSASLISGAILVVLIVVQLILNFSKKLRCRYVPFISLLTLLSLVVLIGSSKNDLLIESLYKGWFPFMLLQTFIIWSLSKRSKVENSQFSIV